MTCNSHLFYYLHLFHYAGFVGAQFLNSILVLLIVSRPGRVLGYYRHAMLVFTLISMFYSMVELLVQPVAHMKGSMFFVFMDSNFFNMPKVVGEFFTSLHCVLSGLVASLLACQFVYRYLALCRTHLLRHLEGGKIFLIFIPSAINLVVWHFCFFHWMPNSPEKMLYLEEELATCFHVDSYSIPLVGPMYWSRDPETETIHWRMTEVAASATCTGTIIISFLIIVFCAWQILGKMNEVKLHFSKKTTDVNRQLFKMLVIQTVIPMITMYTPVALFAILPAFGKDIPYLGNLTSGSLAVYPLIEPVIALFCIGSFRRAILDALDFSSDRSSKFSIHPGTPSRVSTL